MEDPAAVHIDHGGWISGSCLAEDARISLARELVSGDDTLPALLSAHEARQLLVKYQQRLSALVSLIDER